ncbi:hypothetical protein [Burkholderia metallica]|uniref:Uncharacterized protein n=1 Tax=Burkholderia metallica TaxID=488729 RepID=A0ABT8PDK1_9BURK|nr:hypothetical protein [Burkholderia metallica]MDN7933166.1 hypothetical protein [Burkholderia metallica]
MKSIINLPVPIRFDAALLSRVRVRQLDLTPSIEPRPIKPAGIFLK